MEVRVHRLSVICSLCAVAAACYRAPTAAANNPQATEPVDRAGARVAFNSSAISPAELQASSASNLYDAINQVRPAFFMSRSRTSLLNEPDEDIVVIVDRRVLGGVSELRDIATKITKSVKRLTAAEVYQITGKRASSGGVEVVLGQ
jgi:hypothetical protein